RTSEAHDEAGGDGIAGAHHDRNGGRSVLGGHDRLVAYSYDDIHFRIDEFPGEAWELPRTSFGKAVFHRDLLAFGISELPHPVLEMSRRNRGAKTEIPDFRKLLCLRRSEARAPEEQNSGNKWSRQGADPI